MTSYNGGAYCASEAPMGRQQVPTPYPASKQQRLSEIVEKMLATPRAQFNIYLVNNVPASRQQEVVSYRGGPRRGEFKRIQLDASSGQRVSSEHLYDLIRQDLETYFYCFYTYFTAPSFGMFQDSENVNYLNEYQMRFPESVRNLRLD